MNTENSKTNESNKFIYQFTDKLNLTPFLTFKIPLNLSSKKRNFSRKSTRIRFCRSCFGTLNLFNNSYQQASKVLFTFVPNKQFGELITIPPYSLTMLKTTNTEIQSIQVLFTDQINRSLEIEDSVNVTVIIG